MYDGLEEVTRLFDGKTVFIQSCTNKKWVTTREDMELHPVFCTADEPLKWEKFTIGVLKDGWCFFRAFTGEYLSVRKDCHSKFYKTPKVDPRDNPYVREDCTAPLVYASAEIPQAWEMFKIYKVNNHYVIESQISKKWLNNWYDSYYGSEELAAFGLWSYDSNCFFDIFEEDKIV